MSQTGQKSAQSVFSAHKELNVPKYFFQTNFKKYSELPACLDRHHIITHLT